MKYVECVHKSETVSLTKGKIYEVIHFEADWVRIINDDGNKAFYYLKDYLVDATPHIREQKLKQLGI